MTEAQYWDGTATLTRDYRRADEIMQKRRNQEAWLQGMYVYEAILDCAPLLHAFAKHPKAQPYSSEPYPITPADRRERAEREKKKRMDRARTRLSQWAAQVNAQIAARKEREIG